MEKAGQSMPRLNLDNTFCFNHYAFVGISITKAPFILMAK